MNRKNYLLAFILCVQTLFVSAQVYPVRAKLTDEKSFSMILYPIRRVIQSSMPISHFLSYRQHG